ncbi:MAG TPA: GGDEF domain-containing protein [Dyella sp.]|uniref:GGDEF domain-containing protein n=1 Tax=Dyella sp. TaxID=1869338 RepID=UPI002B9AB5B1|nr:GGDEF domain-containing protein [Dyella sp.]HUB90668.1 GGDEF domain-containing protein [Dyella sp.]
MSALPRHICVWSAIVAVAWGLLVHPAYASSSITDPAKLLAQADSVRAKHRAQFLQIMAQLHREASSLSESEQWYLRYLDAWNAEFEGNYAKAELGLRQIIDRSGDQNLAARASSLLVKRLSTNRHYMEAFALANHLASILPGIKDPRTRFELLTDLSETLDFAGQTDLAIQYARMAQDALPPGETECLPLVLEATALLKANRLTSTSSLLHQANNVCTASRKTVLANITWLTLATLYTQENHANKAIALLDQIAPAVRGTDYYYDLLSFQVERAQAYLRLNNISEAKEAALAALAMRHPDDTGDWIMDDYEVLYEIEKKQRHEAAALIYHERYSALEKSHLDDLHARALAYDMTEQHLLVQKMQADDLSKQNDVLQLQQALASKAVETSRLYIALLSLLLISVVAWMFRLKRSQLRFKELSSLDGLTGIFNHQHFMGEADRTLHQLEKRRGIACLIAIDLDHFKQINDTHGHAFGDIVLTRTVTICRQHLRPQDLFGRLGGEEFCVLLPDCRRDQGMAIADHIRAALEAALIETDVGVIAFSASLGVACTDACGYDLSCLCRDADAALYRAKRGGRNRVMATADIQDSYLKRAG